MLNLHSCQCPAIAVGISEYQLELWHTFSIFITDFEQELEPWLPFQDIILVVGFWDISYKGLEFKAFYL